METRSQACAGRHVPGLNSPRMLKYQLMNIKRWKFQPWKTGTFIITEKPSCGCVIPRIVVMSIVKEVLSKPSCTRNIFNIWSHRYRNCHLSYHVTGVCSRCCCSCSLLSYLSKVAIAIKFCSAKSQNWSEIGRQWLSAISKLWPFVNFFHYQTFPLYSMWYLQ